MTYGTFIVSLTIGMALIAISGVVIEHKIKSRKN
ncbi:hypothetical protein Dacet_2569 [Denitrovibrio acetiphilus DSM 12809]|jgi:hypothetical protein|uniref:Uncharacterized protein n=1 Tax=Denitrovibrio acetiphilus (strain DSM 12809 / NBRC 114555 / N2460) TaxID=522772 RepID=D4H4X2_DENA2|nr:hypothetical protein Dacet_2569 [Denitrovibrio acetiphilus DSM 12809]